ncbi:FAD/NAD(P)-binding oxidoreductase [Sulfurovum sp. TSL1]|uniref:NAD(P)/FAD-dependent oxidoreductase n=1 Tax=Sulfurovum sp. TSL1 TaxID=2826994 RepID=UPI001CC74A20|nr:FAD/NAD(P)-binding oxidoreductase [Sulfurovum sp. TSL1]GIT99128.1 flavocytochrome C sulfide dehydrogenase [Sulfurovum sp. TSL1]
MAMNRRDTFKLAGVAAAVAAMPSMAVASEKKAAAKKTTGKSVVIVGGGFGGLTIAKALRKKDENIEVTVIEKNNIFMACPFSNTLLGGLDGVSLDTLVGDYYQPAAKYAYNFVHATVTDIDRKSKTVATTTGDIAYDILVLSPGIAYDYEKQFPAWSAEKIAEVSQACPAALMPGNEHIALKRQLENMDDGNVIIVPPASGKYRCPPAPYERTAMLANYMKNEGIEGKVIVLDTRNGNFAKGKAFQESWNDLFPDIIEYHGLTEVIDVDTAKKTITYKVFEDEVDEQGVTKTEKYEVCNLIPINKCSPVVAMAGIEVDGAGFAMMDGYSFRSKTDSNIYVVGDAVSHAIPASGQTAIWTAHRAAGQISDQLNSRVNDPKEGLPAKAANVCYSMVGSKPEEAIMVTHTFTADESGKLLGTGNVPKPNDGGGKFRSKGTAKATREWFGGVMRELFS